VLETLNLTMAAEQREARVALPVDASEARLLQVLGQQPIHVDEIRSQTGMPIEKVTSTLALMELKGMVRQVGGMNYVAVREASEEYQVGE
jgi:DNA processing protein